ncbi:hypothetical protein JJB07_07780 [Tumebacillus sp. ITR2]|uniref:Uncharacterized protein n=1 Tax=Tumebacillus amylolyticus TaxID=2801339 RepID=A0ABS1J8G4_9BACL|nr:G1 family glutamic endopeptidase [Tumebacillus amylolyticus]MBL0386546.1 hypothetical protein [Tumebacillus amylolyticus]
MNKTLVVTVTLLTSISALTTTSYASTMGAAKASQANDPVLVEAAKKINSDMTVNLPPKGFDPLTATEQELRQYGFPPKPKDSTELKVWEDHMKQAKEFVFPNLSVEPLKKTAAYYDSNIWSGYIASAGYDGWYSKVAGGWTVPTVTSSTQDSDAACWVGLGGQQSRLLIQAGTISEATTHWLSSTTSTNYAFWEMLPSYPSVQKITGLPVSPGQLIYTHINYVSNGAEFYVQNQSTGQYTSFVMGNAAQNYDGNTAEWIMERTTSNKTATALANFSYNNYNSSFAGTNSVSKSAGAWSAAAFRMFNTGTNKQLAHPGALDSAGTNFTVFWDNYL